ncbi:MAG: hypothetical protein MZU79_06365 [Anaerotruncus sp.]|nr:hypothetical protein [Anaerotruncus sp.]
MKKSKVLRKAIMARRAVAVPGCHDALSAKVIEKAGFEAIQISRLRPGRRRCLGKPDVGLVQMKDVLDLTWNIAQAVERSRSWPTSTPAAATPSTPPGSPSG